MWKASHGGSFSEVQVLRRVPTAYIFLEQNVFVTEGSSQIKDYDHSTMMFQHEKHFKAPFKHLWALLLVHFLYYNH